MNSVLLKHSTNSLKILPVVVVEIEVEVVVFVVFVVVVEVMVEVEVLVLVIVSLGDVVICSVESSQVKHFSQYT